jgi:hypothetical protein
MSAIAQRVLSGLLLIVLLFGAGPAAELQAADDPPLGQPAWVQHGLPHHPLPARASTQMAPVKLQDVAPPLPSDYRAREVQQDTFGYRWSDISFQGWISAAGGSSAGVSPNAPVSPNIDIGFPFRFYEYTFTQLSVALSGYVGFTWMANEGTPASMPAPEPPNNLIAPFWLPVVGIDGYVNYLRGGQAPNRWFVVEWNRVRPIYDMGGGLTYEMILHENGDIFFLILAANIVPGTSCALVGIENAEGRDGLGMRFCPSVGLPFALHVYRPPATARVQLWPDRGGAFASPGGSASMVLVVRNIGDLGTDTFDITPQPESSVALFYGDGVTPLEDTDGDGIIDTGPVARGDHVRVVARLAMPPSAQVGAGVTALLTFSPSAGAGSAVTVPLQATVPHPFAHVFNDYFAGQMQLLLARPEAQAVRPVATDYAYRSAMAVIEAANHDLVYSWTRSRCYDNPCTRDGWEVEFTILDPYGETVTPIKSLTDFSNAAHFTFEEATTAALGDGHIGFLSRRYQHERGTNRFNFNIYWTVVNQTGDIVVGPVNLTDNTVWGVWGAQDVPVFWSPQISAIGHDRFVLAWVRHMPTADGDHNEIYYSVRSSSGAEVKPVTLLASGTPGASMHVAPALAAVQGDRALLSWSWRRPGNDQIVYTVLDSNGAVVRPTVELSAADQVTDWDNMDAVQLANGAIVAVWQAWGCVPGEWRPRIRMAVLDAGFNPVGPPQCLITPSGSSYGDLRASVVAADADHAAITWQGDTVAAPNHLFYAVVYSSGTVTTAPTIFLTNPGPYYWLLTNGVNGYSSAPVTWQPPDGMDSAVALYNPMRGITPGGVTTVEVRLTGRGAAPATGVTLTATLDPRLRYVGDSSGVTPTVSGSVVTWELPDLRLFDIQAFTVEAENVDGEPGAVLTVEMALDADQADIAPANNTATILLPVFLPVYLPLVLK